MEDCLDFLANFIVVFVVVVMVVMEMVVKIVMHMIDTDRNRIRMRSDRMIEKCYSLIKVIKTIDVGSLGGYK